MSRAKSRLLYRMGGDDRFQTRLRDNIMKYCVTKLVCLVTIFVRNKDCVTRWGKPNIKVTL